MELLDHFLCVRRWAGGRGPGWEPLCLGCPLGVLPGSDLQASHLGGSSVTSLENHLWVMGGWLVRARGHSGSLPSQHPLCHLKEPVSLVGACITSVPGWEGQAELPVTVPECLGAVKGRRQDGPGFNLTLGFPAVRPWVSHFTHLGVGLRGVKEGTGGPDWCSKSSGRTGQSFLSLWHLLAQVLGHKQIQPTPCLEESMVQ